ncbi:hypothetical protein GEMRC1_010757 [Eukaryota sp. GEM-RC1]
MQIDISNSYLIDANDITPLNPSVEELEQKQEKINSLEDDLAHHRSLLSKATQAEEQLRNEVSALEEKLSTLEQATDEKLQSTKNSHDNTIEIFKTRLNQALQDLKRKNTELGKIRRQIEETTDRMELLKQENRSLTNELRKMKTSDHTLKKQIVDIQAQYEQKLQANLQETKKLRETFKRDCTRFESAQNQVEDQNKQLGQKIEQYEQKCHKLTIQNKTLEERLSNEVEPLIRDKNRSEAQLKKVEQRHSAVLIDLENKTKELNSLREEKINNQQSSLQKAKEQLQSVSQHQQLVNRLQQTVHDLSAEREQLNSTIIFLKRRILKMLKNSLNCWINGKTSMKELFRTQQSQQRTLTSQASKEVADLKKQLLNSCQSVQSLRATLEHKDKDIAALQSKLGAFQQSSQSRTNSLVHENTSLQNKCSSVMQENDRLKIEIGQLKDQYNLLINKKAKPRDKLSPIIEDLNDPVDLFEAIFNINSVYNGIFRAVLQENAVNHHQIVDCLIQHRDSILNICLDSGYELAIFVRLDKSTVVSSQLYILNGNKFSRCMCVKAETPRVVVSADSLSLIPGVSLVGNNLNLRGLSEFWQVAFEVSSIAGSKVKIGTVTSVTVFTVHK